MDDLGAAAAVIRAAAPGEWGLPRWATCSRTVGLRDLEEADLVVRRTRAVRDRQAAIGHDDRRSAFEPACGRGRRAAHRQNALDGKSEDAVRVARVACDDTNRVGPIRNGEVPDRIGIGRLLEVRERVVALIRRRASVTSTCWRTSRSGRRLPSLRRTRPSPLMWVKEGDVPLQCWVARARESVYRIVPRNRDRPSSLAPRVTGAAEAFVRRNKATATATARSDQGWRRDGREEGALRMPFPPYAQ